MPDFNTEPSSEAVQVYRGPQDRVRAIADALADAPAVSAVAQCAEDASDLAFRLLGEGMAALHLTRMVAELNDVMTRRLLDLIAPKHDVADIQWCWMALGSEGRLEQTLYTDQDNAIIFTCPTGEIENVRQRLLPFARDVNQALARCGFRLCPGDIMAGNPRWCLHNDEWRQRFAKWINTGDPESLLHGAIFFDFRALHGEVILADALRQWLSETVHDKSLFLRQMSENALINRPPIGLFGRKSPLTNWLRRNRALDVKKHGVAPFSDVARVLALSRGLSVTNSTERLLGWARTPAEQKRAESWTRALAALQTYRLQRQMHCAHTRTAMDNTISPTDMSEFDRSVVHAALHAAHDAQMLLAVQYQLR